jgi:hypothetical protein
MSSIDINSLKDCQLNPGQFAWMMSLNYLNDKDWIRGYQGVYQENIELRVQVIIHDEGYVQITTWELS